MKATKHAVGFKAVTQSEIERPNPPDNETLAPMYHYAVLDDADIVIDVIATPFPAPADYTQYIEIDSLDESLIGLKYNRETGEFEDPSVSIVGDASQITYNHNPAYRLDAKINEMSAWLHSHSNSVVLDEITAERVAAWDAGTGSGGGTIDAYTKSESDFLFAARGESYTKAESDAKYAPIGQGGGTGTDGITPHIGENGNWFIGVADTGVRAAGITPHIGGNGNWFIEAVDTGVKASGRDGVDGAPGKDGVDGLPGKDGSEITATEVLTKLKTVDGNNSGLDADTVDGKHSSDFAKAGHTHVLTDINGTVPISKGGTGATSAQAALLELGAAPSNHSHTGYAPSGHSHTGFAPEYHTHSGYADTNHAHYEYASSGHSHSCSEIGAADSNHTHDTFDWETFFNDIIHLKGQLRVGGNQMVYSVAGQGTSTISSNNVETNLAGKKLYARVPLTVNSDERLKKNVDDVNAQALIDFLRLINIKQYELNDEGNSGEKHLGVIAQQLIAINPSVAKYFVSANKDTGMYGVAYESLVLPLILAVQNLTYRVEELEAELVPKA